MIEYKKVQKNLMKHLIVNAILATIFTSGLWAQDVPYYNRTVDQKQDVGAINQNFRDIADRKDVLSDGDVPPQYQKCLFSPMFCVNRYDNKISIVDTNIFITTSSKSSGGVCFPDGTCQTSAGVGSSGISVNSQQFSGNGTIISPLTLQNSSVTLQGNVFNGTGQLVMVDGSGKAPISISGNADTATTATNAPNYVLKSGDTMTGTLNGTAFIASDVSFRSNAVFPTVLNIYDPSNGQIHLSMTDDSFIYTPHNFGVGTLLPNFILDVAGTANFSDNIIVGSTVAASIYTGNGALLTNVIHSTEAIVLSTGQIYNTLQSEISNRIVSDSTSTALIDTKVSKFGDTMSGQLTNLSSITVSNIVSASTFSINGQTFISKGNNVTGASTVIGLFAAVGSYTTCTAIGYNAGNNCGGGNNTYIGVQAGALGNGDGNTIVGSAAGTTGSGGTNNTIIGAYAGFGKIASHTGFTNSVIIGYGAGKILDTGSDNIFIGRNTADGTTSRSNSIMIGSNLSDPKVDGFLNIGNLVNGIVNGSSITIKGIMSVRDELQTNGEYNIGTSTATFFYGDGSHLTNLQVSGAFIMLDSGDLAVSYLPMPDVFWDVISGDIKPL